MPLKHFDDVYGAVDVQIAFERLPHGEKVLQEKSRPRSVRIAELLHDGDARTRGARGRASHARGLDSPDQEVVNLDAYVPDQLLPKPENGSAP
eukprot:5593335-Pyramimonas_sp.AAC.1